MEGFYVEKYTDKMEEKWDKFVEKNAFNGTFLQSRNFLNYHPKDRFQDASIIIYYKNTSEIMAVVPAAQVYEKGKKIFYSHPGSTFGGIVFNKQFYNLKCVEIALDRLEEFCKSEGYNEIILKQSGQIFSIKNNDLLEYFLFNKRYRHNSEISFVIDFQNYEEDILSNFTSSRRRDYKYGAKSGLNFKELFTREEIVEFYELLCENLQKFGAKPVHSKEELLDFKFSRLRDNVRFFGTYLEERIVAGAMVFLFGDRVFHTQYLAASQKDLNLFPNNYNDAHLIMVAKEERYPYFSFGISTEEQGKVLNKSLAEFKEGFGTEYRNNKIWYKDLE